MAKVEIDGELCKGCGLCVEVCPRGGLRISSRLNRMGEHPVEWASKKECSGCGLCAVVCPDCALTIYGESAGGKEGP